MNNNADNNNDNSFNKPFIPLTPMEGESPAAFEAFTIYLRMEKRSLKNLIGMVSATEATIRDWSAKFNWSQRILAHEAQLVNASLAHEAELKKQKALSRLSLDAMLQQLMSDLTIYLFKSAETSIKNQVQTNPTAIGISSGLKMIGEARQLLKSTNDQPDKEAQSKEDCLARAKAVIARLEDHIAAQNKSPQSENPPAPESGPKN